MGPGLCKNARNGVALLVTALALLVPLASARAFCRTTTVEPLGDTCSSCESEGYPLAWPQGTIRYVLNERGFPGYSEASLRAALQESFDPWLSVTCDGDPVELDVAASSELTRLTARPKETAFRTNVIGHLSAFEWANAGFDRHAFAQTSVRYDRATGIIYGADIWFNGGVGDYTACADTGCSSLDRDVDLRNVATHEIGHFLGLAHTRVEGATMTCNALRTEVDKRTLEADDEAGLCEIYPPGIAFQSQYVQGKWSERSRDEGDSACSARPGDGASGAVPVAALAALALIMQRRRLRA